MRNPKGENGSTKSWQREILLLRTLSALDELQDEELRQEALQAIAQLVINRAIQGDSRVLCRLVDRLWPI